MDNPCLIVLCTCPNAEEAERIAHSVVNERLAACVNIILGIRSVYRWQDAVESAEEILLLLKTSEAVFPKLRDRIIELHSYVTPEVIAAPITAGSEKYLSWLRAQLE